MGGRRCSNLAATWAQQPVAVSQPQPGGRWAGSLDHVERIRRNWRSWPLPRYRSRSIRSESGRSTTLKLCPDACRWTWPRTPICRPSSSETSDEPELGNKGTERARGVNLGNLRWQWACRWLNVTQDAWHACLAWLCAAVLAEGSTSGKGGRAQERLPEPMAALRLTMGLIGPCATAATSRLGRSKLKHDASAQGWSPARLWRFWQRLTEER